MTLLDHQEFRFYEQEPAGVHITVGIRQNGSQPLATGEYVVRGDEAGLPILVHMQDSTGREIAQIVFLLSCAPGTKTGPYMRRIWLSVLYHTACLFLGNTGIVTSQRASHVTVTATLLPL